MGGSIALTIRWSASRDYRGSCWTNILPDGLWAAPFYDPARSQRHAWTWLSRVLRSRSKDPQLEAMWGGHNKLAPLGYGIVIIDYVSSSLISAQGYSHPDRVHLFKHDHEHHPERVRKVKALERGGFLGETEEDLPPSMGAWVVKLPFRHVRVGDVDLIDEELAQWAHDTFGLSDEELAAWTDYIRERNE
jgi:hypothetical protein